MQAHRDNYRNFGTGGGNFGFSQLETRLPGVANSGNAFASFLLGAVDTGSSYFRSSLPGGRYKYYGVYVDDTYKLTPKLTVDLGLRYEIQVPASDPLGRISYMNPAVPNPGAGNLPGAEVFGNNGTGLNQFTNTHYKNFGPRAGFAWSITPKTVLRGGYGIFYAAVYQRRCWPPAEWILHHSEFQQPGQRTYAGLLLGRRLPAKFQSSAESHAHGAERPKRPACLSDLGRSDPLFPAVQRDGRAPGHRLADGERRIRGKQRNSHLRSECAGESGKSRIFFAGPGDASIEHQFAAGPGGGHSGAVSGFAQLFGAQATVAQALRPFPQYQGVSDRRGAIRQFDL